MASLSELRAKYDLQGATYEPNPSCRFCNGTGEKPIKRRPGQVTFCICLFVEHSASDEVGGLLGRFASDKLAEMERATEAG